MQGMGKACVAAATAGMTLALAPVAWGEQYDVNVTYDTPFDATCEEGPNPTQDDDCTLREAVVAANVTTSDDEVFVPALAPTEGPPGTFTPQVYPLDDPLPGNQVNGGNLVIRGGAPHSLVGFPPPSAPFTRIVAPASERGMTMNGPVEIRDLSFGGGAGNAVAGSGGSSTPTSTASLFGALFCWGGRDPERWSDRRRRAAGDFGQLRQPCPSGRFRRPHSPRAHVDRAHRRDASFRWPCRLGRRRDSERGSPDRCQQPVRAATRPLTSAARSTISRAVAQRRRT